MRWASPTKTILWESSGRLCPAMKARHSTLPILPVAATELGGRDRHVGLERDLWDKRMKPAQGGTDVEPNLAWAWGQPWETF